MRTLGAFAAVAATIAAAGSLYRIATRTVVACAAPAVLCVTPNGNDTTAARGNLNAPCATWSKCYQLAQPGDTIQTTSGQYPFQTIAYDATKASSTFGDTTAEALLDNALSNRTFVGAPFTVSAGGTLTSMSVYVDGLRSGGAGTQKYKLLVYNWNGSACTSLVASSAEGTVTAGDPAAWVTLSASATIAAGSYCVGFIVGSPSNTSPIQWHYKAAGTTYENTSTAYPTIADPCSCSTVVSNVTYSVYASITAAPVTFALASGANVKIGAMTTLTADFIEFCVTGGGCTGSPTQVISVADTSAFVLTTATATAPCANQTSGTYYCITMGLLQAACSGKTATSFTGCTNGDTHCTDGVSCDILAGGQAWQTGLRLKGAQNVNITGQAGALEISDQYLNNSNTDPTVATGSPAYPSNDVLSYYTVHSTWTRGPDHITWQHMNLCCLDVSLPVLEMGGYSGEPATTYQTFTDTTVHNSTAEKALLGPGYGGNHIGGIKWDDADNITWDRCQMYHNDIYDFLIKDSFNGGGGNRHDITVENCFLDAQWNESTGLRGGAGASIEITPPTGTTFTNINLINDTIGGTTWWCNGCAGAFATSSASGNIEGTSWSNCATGVTYTKNLTSTGTCGTDTSGITLASLVVNANGNVPDYHLLGTASQAIGQLTSGYPVDDIDGCARTNPTDIGADQYNC